MQWYDRCKALELELELATLLGMKIVHVLRESGRIVTTSGDVPLWSRSNGAAFKLMAQFKCMPDCSNDTIPYNQGWASVPGTDARVCLEECSDLEEAFRVVILMAAIEKVKRTTTI